MLPNQGNTVNWRKDIKPKPDSPALDATGKKYVQQVVGSFLYYTRATDLTILHALNSIAADSSKPTERTMESVQQLIDDIYLNPDAIIGFRRSDMILNVHSDASCQTASIGRSRAGGYFFLGNTPNNDHPIKLNGNITVACAILKLVSASAAEAELGALFLNTQ